MALFSADETLDRRLLWSNVFLLAALANMSHLAASPAFWNHAIHSFPCILKTCFIVINRSGPSGTPHGTLGLPAVVKTSHKFAANFALQVHVGKDVIDCNLPGDDEGIEVVVTEMALELQVGSSGDSLGVDLEGLHWKVSWFLSPGPKKHEISKPL